MIKVIICDQLSQKTIESLKEIPEFEVIDHANSPGAGLEKIIPGADALVIRGTTHLTREILELTPKLKVIVRAGVGLDNVDVDFANSQGTVVKNTPFATSITAAEYTLALLLGICRFIGPAYMSMKAHRWEKQNYSDGIELFGKTAGLIGFGRIGQEVAKRLLALGMKVIYHDLRTIETDLSATQVPFDQLLKNADFISIHLPLTPASRAILSEAEFSKMKHGAVVVNVSRSQVIDGHALLKALNQGKLRAVALDVFENEPPATFALIDHKKVYPAPHLGASTVEGQDRAGMDVISILRDFFNV